MDVFIEKIIKKRKTMTDRLVTIGIILATLLAIMFLPSIPFVSGFSVFVIAGLAYAAYLVITSRNVEFEYAVTNGEVDIDKIVSQRKRKRIFSGSCKTFDIVARVNSDKFTPDVQSIKKQIDASSTPLSPDAFFATTNYKGERVLLIFEPDQRMLDIFKTFLPRKVFE